MAAVWRSGFWRTGQWRSGVWRGGSEPLAYVPAHQPGGHLAAARTLAVATASRSTETTAGLPRVLTVTPAGRVLTTTA